MKDCCLIFGVRGPTKAKERQLVDDLGSARGREPNVLAFPFGSDHHVTREAFPQSPISTGGTLVLYLTSLGNIFPSYRLSIRGRRGFWSVDIVPTLRNHHDSIARSPGPGGMSSDTGNWPPRRPGTCRMKKAYKSSPSWSWTWDQSAWLSPSLERFDQSNPG